MVQIILPNGGVTTLDEHEVNSFPDRAGVVLPAVPAGADPASVDPYLTTVKLDQTVAAQ